MRKSYQKVVTLRDSHPVTVLLVEDDPGHTALIESNLRRGGIHNDIIKLSNGKQALDYLYSRGEFDGMPRQSPLLMLLDLNIPGIDGIEVLETVKADPELQNIPVIIVTAADDQQEIERCYKLGCNLYIPKPVEYESFASIIRELGLLMIVTALPNP